MLQIANNQNVKKGAAKKEQNYKSRTSSLNLKKKKQFKRKGPQREDAPVENTSTLFNFATKKNNDDSDASDDNIVCFKKTIGKGSSSRGNTKSNLDCYVMILLL